MTNVVEKKPFNLPSNFIGNGENRLLPINAQRLLFYACWKCEPKEREVSFSLQEYRQQFNNPFRNFDHIKQALKQLFYYNFIKINDEKQTFHAKHVFTDIEFENSIFTLKFNEGFQEQIIETKKQFLKYGLGIVSEWQCKYTILLYNYLKEKMFASKHKYFTLKELRTLFKLEETEYLNNKDFRLYCWSKAVDEINRTTGYVVAITYSGRGKDTLFDLTVTEKENIVSAEHTTSSTTADSKHKPVTKGKNNKRVRSVEVIPDYMIRQWMEDGRYDKLDEYGIKYDKIHQKKEIEENEKSADALIEQIEMLQAKLRELEKTQISTETLDKVFG